MKQPMKTDAPQKKDMSLKSLIALALALTAGILILQAMNKADDDREQQLRAFDDAMRKAEALHTR